MVVLNESSLNKRHREYNRKLAEAVANNVNFDDVKAEGDETDIDYLFKIDLASKYKNIDYILEALKSGDSLRISRALKCSWMYDSEYSHIINPQFINDNIFPHLSLKSKKKLVNTISVYVRDEKRLLEFYEFCKSHKYNDIGLKFLLFTSEETKIKLLNEDYTVIHNRGWTYVRDFIGNSFNLAKYYLEKAQSCDWRQILYELRYLYSNPDIGTKYLDLIERCVDNLSDWNYYCIKFGLRMSKDIILKHKDRIYNKPRLYTSLINKSMFVRYSTVEDAKYYTTALMPDDADKFWSINYYEKKRHFFDIIPMEEKYQFIKKIFTDKYPGAPFETTIHFYRLQYYNLIVDLELKEEWALRHVASEKEILGPGKDYLWYRFIKFEKSFEEIKKYIRINRDADIRAEIIDVLIESARNDLELETLFKYYYERHVNEEKYRKERFLDSIDQRHSIFNLSADCFAALDKIYYSLEVYNVLSTLYVKPEYKLICFIYRIINTIEMPEAMVKFMDDSVPFYTLRCYTRKLMPEQEKAVIKYLMEFYLKIINSFNDKPYDDCVKSDVRKYVTFALDLLYQYDKPKEEIPEIVMKYVNLDMDEFKFHFYFRTSSVKEITQDDLMRCMKRDTSEFISKFPELKQRIKERYPLKVNRVVKKLRVYFSNDLAVKYLNFCQDVLKESDVDKRTVDIIVYGIIHLASKTFLEEFMTKHVPVDAKIDHVAIDRKLLSIQSAICSLAGYARPPVPLSLILKYMKGDYTQYCLPLFNMYQANLQPKPCNEFVNSVIDAPLSIQKHGIRLAFKFFSISDLCNLVTETWRRTKNVSLRSNVYKALHAKILDDASNAASLFGILNRFTSTIYQEDDPELFSLLTSDTLPITFRNEHIKTVWDTCSKLPLKTPFTNYRVNALRCIENNISIIEPQEFIENIVKDHIQYIFDQNKEVEIYEILRKDGVIRAKWQLTAKYLTYLKNKERVEEKLCLAKSIISICFKNWHTKINGTKAYRNLFVEFLNMLKTKSSIHELDSYKCVNVLFECILKELEDALHIEEIYQITWELKLNIRTRVVIIDSNERKTDENLLHIAKEAAMKYSKVCVDVVNEYIEKNIFWIMFYDSIQNTIMSEAQNIVNNLNCSQYMQTSDMLVLVCKDLIELKRFEVLFVMLKILQSSNKDGVFATEYQKVLDKMKTIEDDQIKCYFYQKFIRNNKEGSTFM